MQITPELVAKWIEEEFGAENISASLSEVLFPRSEWQFLYLKSGFEEKKLNNLLAEKTKDLTFQENLVIEVIDTNIIIRSFEKISSGM